MIKTNLPILIFLSFIGCQTIIEIPVPNSSEKIIVNALFNPDSLMKVRVYESINFYDSAINFNLITNAKLTASSSSGMEYSFHYDDGYYISENFPDYGETYELNVTAPGYPDTVRAITTIAGQKPDFQIIDFGYKFYEDYCDRRFYIEIELDDPPRQDNFYALSVGFERLIYNIDANKQIIEDTTWQYHWLEIYHVGSEYLYKYGSRLNFCINGKYFDGESTKVTI